MYEQSISSDAGKESQPLVNDLGLLLGGGAGLSLIFEGKTAKLCTDQRDSIIHVTHAETFGGFTVM